jgi:hypothetical protein
MLQITTTGKRLKSRAEPKNHKLIFTANIKKQLASSLHHAVKNRRYALVAVPMNSVIDPVVEMVAEELQAIGSRRVVRPYLTEHYLLKKHFNLSPSKFKPGPPWLLESAFDETEIENIKNGAEWQDDYAHQVSERIFGRFGEGKEVAIVPLKVLCNPEQVSKLVRYNPVVINFNPGANDFQDYYRPELKKDEKVKTVEKNHAEVSKKYKFKIRPDDKNCVLQLERLETVHITDSPLVADLIPAAYRSVDLPLDIIEDLDEAPPASEATILLSSMASKRYSGFLPIMLEHLNKEHWERKGVIIGDGVSSPFNFNHLRVSLSQVGAPCLIRMSEPHPLYVQAISKQLELDFNLAKRSIIEDRAWLTRLRTEGNPEVYVLCSKRTANQLGLHFKNASNVVDATLDHRAFKRWTNANGEHSFAKVIRDCKNVAATLTKSRSAVDRYIRKNNLIGQSVTDVVTAVLLAITFTIRDELRDQEFLIDINSLNAQSFDGVSGKLLTLAQYLINKHVESRELPELLNEYSKVVKQLEYRTDERTGTNERKAA